MWDLKDIWCEARSAAIDARLSDERLFFLGRLHLSLHALAACTHPAALAGEEASILQRVDALFDECLLRCHRTDKLSRLSRLVPLLYLLGKPEYVPLDAGRLENCDRMADKLVGSWAESSFLPWESLHGILRTVTEQAGDLDGEEREADVVFRKYADTLSGWYRALSSARTWTDIPAREAWSRLELLCRHSSMLPDTRCDGRLLSLYAGSVRMTRVSELPGETRLLCLSVERMLGRSRSVSGLSARLRKESSQLLDASSSGSDVYWSSLSVLAECACMARIDFA